MSRQADLPKLNLPQPTLVARKGEKHDEILCLIRRKWVALEPEEWVRQHCLRFLMEEKKYPKSLINIEKELLINSVKKRYDIVIFNSDGSIHLIVECKAPTININQNVFDQIALYNLSLNATYLMISNGINHYYCQMDFKKEKYHFLKDIPEYTQ